MTYEKKRSPVSDVLQRGTQRGIHILYVKVTNIGEIVTYARKMGQYVIDEITLQSYDWWTYTKNMQLLYVLCT